MTSLRKLLLGFLAGSSVAAFAAGGDATVPLSADIAPQPLTVALAAFGRQSGLQLIYVSEIADTQHSKGARAGLTASAALTQLLEGTGLTFEFLNARTVRIFPAPVVPAAVAPLAGLQHARERSAFALEEVIVTATRRKEAMNRVPIDMVVWTPEAMQASGVKGMSELASLTAAMQFQAVGDTGGTGLTYLVMRGVAGRNASTTGVYLDDTPLPPISGDLLLHSFPFTFDLDRVEVLRGPQLQLFAEGNEGGAVRFIPNRPSLSTFTGFASTELATIDGGSMTYEAGGAIGGPVIPGVLGFRASAWTRREGGYVDRVDPFTEALVESNANHSMSTSVRGALTLAPNEAMEVTPSVTYTSYKAHDTPYFFTNLSEVSAGQLRSGSLLRQPSDESFYLATLKLTARLGGAQFSALSSYFDRAAQALVDGTNAFNWGSPLGPGYPVDRADAIPDQWDMRQRVFMQELRLTSPDHDAAFTWDAGAFYSNYRARVAEHETAANGIPDFAPAPADLQQVAVGTQTRIAAFAEVSLRMAKRLTVSAGLHEEHAQYAARNELPAFPPAAGVGSGLMPQLRASYQANGHEFFYLTVAKGYGSGGFGPGLITCGETAGAFGMDTVWSYEVGTKSTLLDKRMQLDTGIFHMAWNNGATYLSRCALPGSPGAAASNGFDLASHLLASPHLKLSLDVAYTDARHTRTLIQNGAVVVRQGDAVINDSDGVPLSPWNLTAAADYLVVLGHNTTGDVRVEDVFRSRNPGPFAQQNRDSPEYVPEYRPDPSTNLLNLRATLRWESYDASLFVNNALNALPTLNPVISTFQPSGVVFATTFRPRTIGVTASWRF